MILKWPYEPLRSLPDIDRRGIRIVRVGFAQSNWSQQTTQIDRGRCSAPALAVSAVLIEFTIPVVEPRTIYCTAHVSKTHTDMPPERGTC